MVRKFLIGSAITAVLAVGACRLLLPDAYAINAPIAHMLFGIGGEAPDEGVVGRRIRGPEGHGTGLYAVGIPDARMLLFTPTGDLLVSQPRAGSILLLHRDADGDGRADGRSPLLEELRRPHGLALRDGYLYVGETDAIGRVAFDTASRRTTGPYERIVTGLPGGGNHWSRTIHFGPDGGLYANIGSSCNACIEPDERRGALMRFEADGSGERIYATGLRNTVDFAWRPGTAELYGTDNGRDLLGADYPPCELNRIVDGGFYGWPFANGDREPDPDFGAGQEQRIAASIPPVHDFRAHNAPLGIAFLTHPHTGDGLRGAAVVALHGSWNRPQKDGYKVVSLHWNARGEISERDFLTGFLRGEDVIGRPVGVAQGPDAAVYVSDDYAGVIYRVAPGESDRETVRRRVARSGDPLANLDAVELRERTERGRGLFEQHACASCHDPVRAADGVVPVPLIDLRARYNIDALIRYLETPTPPMPIFPLDAGQRRDLAVWLLRD